MSSEAIVVIATKRDDLGKGASRRLRRNAALMPAIVYGGKKKPVNLSIEHKEMMKYAENEAFFSSVLDLEIDGKTESVIVKDLQRHPARLAILHADFQRVSKSTILHVHVPIHFLNEEACVGVKTEGGKIQHALVEIEVSCKADSLPEYIEVDMAEVTKGQTLHISDLALPKGVTSVQLAHDHDLPVVSVVTPKGADVDEDEGTDEAAATEEGDTEE